MLHNPDDICKDPLQIDFNNLDDLHSDDNELWRLAPVESCEEIDKTVLSEIISKNNKDCLYIIGNGFDLHHKLKTSYLDFREFLKKEKKYSDLLYLFARNFDLPLEDGDKEWNCFEEVIKYSNSIPYIKGYPLNSLTVEESCDLLASEIGRINNSLDLAFYAWVQSIENEMRRQTSLENMEKKLIGKNSIYLSYNYTAVLERFYKISPNNILHLHGLFSESKKESLFLGFGDLNFKVLDSYYKNINYDVIGTDKRAECSVDGKSDDLKRITEESKDNLLSFFKNRNKNYYIQNYRCYEFNTRILNNLKNIRKVIVLGHSFGASDAYSLKLLRDRLSDNDVKWYIGVWADSKSTYKSNYTRMVMYKMFLAKENTRYFLW